ncbi:tryptophan aminotransferase-related protein 1-like [Phragmites australis]|uniref:tryptophan aminotransferase-related protein 1-like n=1 Tax=Phragmites australis TaxID=29695 RepID=UPI002D7A1643|nr:tryptophan aminotransferase-related protein 1-like [Phragmites australis]
MAGKEGSGMVVRYAGRLGVVASVALNLAALALYIRRRFFGGSGSGDGGGGREIATVEPSKGKPLVTPDSVVNLDHGDPTMYEAFWRETGDRATIVIPGCQTMSYFSDVGGFCWFLEPGFEREVRRLHRLVGNAVVDGYHVLVGTGSTQLFQAALYALSPATDGAPMSVVSPAPYYSSYPAVTNFLNSGLYRWAGDANTFDGDTCIELVCSPNNPDGGIRKAVIESKSGKAIHDFAYYWPQYTPITEAAGHDIMLFTVSKCTGHAGTRLGWALVKDREVAQKMIKFIELNTIGVSKDSQLRAAKILGAVCDGYETSLDGEASRLFHFARQQMMERWSKLRAAVAASDIFTLPNELSNYCTFVKETITTNPPFAWLRCEKEGVKDLEGFLREHKIITRGGTKFGVDGRFVRVSMLDTDEAFNVFMDRLASLK